MSCSASSQRAWAKCRELWFLTSLRRQGPASSPGTTNSGSMFLVKVTDGNRCIEFLNPSDYGIRSGLFAVTLVTFLREKRTF